MLVEAHGTHVKLTLGVDAPRLPFIATLYSTPHERRDLLAAGPGRSVSVQPLTLRDLVTYRWLEVLLTRASPQPHLAPALRLSTDAILTKVTK